MLRGARVVADGRDLIHGYAFEVANESAIAAKRTILADFLQREGRALDWAAVHPEDYARVLSTETGLPLDIARIMVRKNSRHVASISPAIINDQKIFIDIFAQAGKIKLVRTLDQAFSIL